MKRMTNKIGYNFASSALYALLLRILLHILWDTPPTSSAPTQGIIHVSTNIQPFRCQECWITKRIRSNAKLWDVC